MQAITQIIIAVVFHVIDLVSGFIGALKNKDVESNKMRDGLFKKVGFLLCYLVAFLLDTYGAEIGLNLGVSVLPAIVLYAVTTEIISIIENISKINENLIPETLLKLFHIDGGDKDA